MLSHWRLLLFLIFCPSCVLYLSFRIIIFVYLFNTLMCALAFLLEGRLNIVSRIFLNGVPFSG